MFCFRPRVDFLSFAFTGSISESMMQHGDNENILSNDHSTDMEHGSVFSSSSSSKDDDFPPLNQRQTTLSGEKNRNFEFIEREIGMCRPVCYFFLISNDERERLEMNNLSSPRMVSMKFMY